MFDFVMLLLRLDVIVYWRFWFVCCYTGVVVV